MAKILIIANGEWFGRYNANQLTDRGHAVRGVDLSPQLSEVNIFFQPEVIVADLSDEHAPSGLLWQAVKVMPDPRPAVIYSPDAVSWGVFFPSKSGKYVMRSPVWEELTKIMESVLSNEGRAAPTGVANELGLMEG